MSKMMEQEERGCMGCMHYIIIPEQLIEYCDLDGNECTHGNDDYENMVEILWNGTVHYRRYKGHPDIIEAEQLIEKQRRLYGESLYSIREVVTTD